MPSFKSVKSKLKSFFRSKQNRDRVYIYDPDYYQPSWFLRFYRAMGCISIPQPEKYNPDTFTDIFDLFKPDVDEDEKEFSNPSKLQSPSSETCEDQDCDFADLEEDLEVIILGEDLPPVESEGSQEEPLPLLVAWEESEPRFFYLGYY